MRYAHTPDQSDVFPGYRVPTAIDLSYWPPSWPLDDPSRGDNLSDIEFHVSSPYAIDLTMEIERYRYRVVRLESRQSPGGPPIGTGELARLPLTAMFNAVTSQLPLWIYSGAPKDYPGSADQWEMVPLGQAIDRLTKELGPREGHPNLIAPLYRLIKLTHPKPTAELARRSEVNDVTVRRWLARAVKLNLLEQDERTR